MTECYTWRGGTELLLRHGADCPVTLLVLPALFEEANRMRQLTVEVMRRLAGLGIGTILADLPGQGESGMPLSGVVLEDWHVAVATHIPYVRGSVAFRGGALLDGAFAHRWRFAADTGERLMRDLVRATAMSSSVSASDVDRAARGGQLRLAGNALNPELYVALTSSKPVVGGHLSAVEGPHLWRAAEPGSDPVLAEALAKDIVQWTMTCGV